HYNQSVNDYVSSLQIPEEAKATVAPIAEAWAAKMIEQRAALLNTLETAKNDYQLKSHGFFSDRLDEVKKIARLQEKEVSIQNLDRSFANFLAEYVEAKIPKSQE